MGEVVVQVVLVLADPGDVAVRAEQKGWDIQWRSGIGDDIDKVRPSHQGP